MAYVNMFATVNGSNRGTSGCMRGQVNNVGIWVNSVLGEVMSANASFHDVELPDMRTIPKERREAVRQEVEDRKQVRLNIDINPNSRFVVTINGVDIPIRQLQALQELERKRFDLQLDALTKMRDEGREVEMMQLATQIMTR